jgi:hypothetical protein
MSNTFYNRVIRKLVVGFGNLFDNITLVRYNPDNSEAQRMVVPIAYASKERYVMRLESDYNLDKKVQITLPRMSFEMNGLSYDASRKQNTNIKQFAKSSNGTLASQYNPVPYNFDFSLYIYVRNIEDGTQIIEHILPYFTPDYTIKLNLIPEMGIVKEIPIVLNNTNYEVTYEGTRENETRMIIWTLNFTVKGFIFGAVSQSGYITSAITTLIDTTLSQNNNVAVNIPAGGLGNYQIGEVVYQGFSLETSTATAKVVAWDTKNSILYLSNINGNFIVGKPLIGAKNNANYTFGSYQVLPVKDAKITITPNPANANANSNYTYTTVIQEAPNVT